MTSNYDPEDMSEVTVQASNFIGWCDMKEVVPLTSGWVGEPYKFFDIVKLMNFTTKQYRRRSLFSLYKKMISTDIWANNEQI